MKVLCILAQGCGRSCTLICMIQNSTLDLFIFIIIKNVHGTYFPIKLGLVYLKITYAMHIHRVQWKGNEHAMLYIKGFDVVTCLELMSNL
jgi:hypothetical protein